MKIHDFKSLLSQTSKHIKTCDLEDGFVFKFGPDNTLIISHLQWQTLSGYTHIRHGAKSFDIRGQHVQTPCVKGLLHQSVYRACSLLLRSKTGTWMLFLSERWRGESLLRCYIDCLVHSFWPMANVNPYVCLTPRPSANPSCKCLR